MRVCVCVHVCLCIYIFVRLKPGGLTSQLGPVWFVPAQSHSKPLNRSMHSPPFLHWSKLGRHSFVTCMCVCVCVHMCVHVCVSLYCTVCSAVCVCM